MTKATVLISGASGFVGTELTNYFSEKGYTVIGLVRDPAKYAAPKNVTYKQYDLGKPFDDAIFKGVDYVVHAAYVKYDREHPDAKDTNIQGAQRIHDAAQKHGVKKVVFMSSMSAHEEAVSVYGKQKLAIEKIFNTKRDAVLRCGLIIGKGGIVHEMVSFLKAKRVVPLVDGGKQPLQIVSVHDLVHVIESVFLKDLSGTLVIANPKVYAYKELYETIGKELGIKLIFVPVPFFVLLNAIRMLTVLRLPLPVNEDNLWGLKMLRSADNAKDIKKTGLTLDTLDQAMKRTGITN